MKEKKFDKSKLLTAVVVCILIFFFVGGFMLGLDRISAMEGTFPPNDITEGLTPAPETAEEAVAYLFAMLDKAVADVPSVTCDDYFSAGSDSLTTDGSDHFNQTLQFAMDNFISHISSVEENDTDITSVGFGEGADKVLQMPDITAEDVESFTCSYIYYSCPSCGKTSDVPLDLCEDCGSLRAYFKKYHNEYDITLVLNVGSPEDENSALIRNFKPRNAEQITALTSDVLATSADVNVADVQYDKFIIQFRVNRLTDEISYLRYAKDMTVSSAVSFKNDYEKLGQKNITLALQENKAFHFTWPSLTLSEQKLVIEPKGTDNLLATLVCENPFAMTVTWTSSDESIATVDEEGYIDVFKKTGEATITASFEYLGKTYSDTCTVFVRVPVESMKMLDKDVTLAVGETATLETKVSPSDATVQTVTWYTEDETIATVNADGVVTAVAKGTCIVYALSDDGYYRSTCEVTVE
ncbi:MAG: hypothetical protein E7523_01215 [Ruminococcaceae bacterium]|nr:hypothetical protein [Oscillospiraceae bacterium]